jgi:hypothetical protein
MGDDRTRFADARGLKAYAAAPVTRAGDIKLVVLHRSVKNNRLAAGGCSGLSPPFANPPVLELITTGGGC